MASLLVVVLAAPISLLAYIVYMFFIKIYLDARRFRRMDPAIKEYIAPFSGLQGVHQENIRKYGDAHRYTKELVKANPDQRAYITNIGYKPLLILCSAELVKQVHTNPRKFRKFNIFKHSYKCYTKGIFFVEGEDWTAEKAIVRHSFNYESLKGMIPIMKSSVTSFLGRIKQQMLEA